MYKITSRRQKYGKADIIICYYKLCTSSEQYMISLYGLIIYYIVTFCFILWDNVSFEIVEYDIYYFVSSDWVVNGLLRERNR